MDSWFIRSFESGNGGKSLKANVDAPLQRNSIVVKNARSNFAQWLMQQGIQHELIFIDEAGIHVWTKRTRGRARVGERAVRIVGAARGQNLTMTCRQHNQWPVASRLARRWYERPTFRFVFGTSCWTTATR